MDGNVQIDMERNRGAVKCLIRKSCEDFFKQGGKYYPQIFVKECKIVENRGSAKSFLDGFETCPPLDS